MGNFNTKYNPSEIYDDSEYKDSIGKIIKEYYSAMETPLSDTYLMY